MASKVHRVRYYSPKPLPIQCISLNKTCKQLAVARGDASIEIWDLNYAPFLLKYIPCLKNTSVEALGWVHNRLLSTGIGGALIEWDLEKLSVKTSILLTGSAAWCLDITKDNSLAAIGTEQGYVNLYDVENDDIIYKKLFDKQEGRILCCKFNTMGKLLVTGSIDTIRVWNVATGHAINRMSVSRRNKQVIVWCLEILSDNTVVSGDSLGRLIFWDGEMGNQIESYTTHKSDILSVAVSPDEKNLYCSGADPVIVNFVKVDKTTSGKQTEAHWVKNVQRNIHEHDVRGLIVLYGEKLVSVGVDGYLTFSSYPPKWVMRLPPITPASRSSVCCKKRLLLLRYYNHLEVWKLGSYSTDKDNILVSNVSTKQNTHHTDKHVIEQDSTIDVMNKSSVKNMQVQRLKLTENPVKLVSIKTKNRLPLTCCEMSSNGELVFYATASDARMLKLENDEEQGNISVSRVMISGMPAEGTNRVAFTDDSSVMVAHSGGSLLVFQVDPDAGATVIQTIPLHKHFKTSSLLHLYISPTGPSGAYLVAGDSVGALAVWRRNGKKFDFHVALPTYQCVPSAMTADTRRDTLVVVYVDQKIVEYELKSKRFAEWPGAALPPAWLARDAAVLAARAHPARDALVFQDLTSLWVLERTTQEVMEPSPKRPNMKDGKPGGMNLGLRIIPIKYLADFHWLDQDEAVMLEVLPENIVSQLPPIVLSKR